MGNLPFSLELHVKLCRKHGQKWDLRCELHPCNVRIPCAIYLYMCAAWLQTGKSVKFFFFYFYFSWKSRRLHVEQTLPNPTIEFIGSFQKATLYVWCDPFEPSRGEENKKGKGKRNEPFMAFDFWILDTRFKLSHGRRVSLAQHAQPELRIHFRLWNMHWLSQPMSKVSYLNFVSGRISCR